MCTGVTLVERVARAICEQAWHERLGFTPDPRHVDDQWTCFIQQAEVAIETMVADRGAIGRRRDNRAMWDGFFFPP